MKRNKRLTAGTVLRRVTPMRHVSPKRARENRERRRIADRMGDAMCVHPDCGRRADDLHELVRRSQYKAGLTDEGNVVPICRPHHTWVTEHPAEAREARFAPLVMGTG